MPRVNRLPIVLDQTQADRFWSNVNRAKCWTWTGRTDDFGYGHFKANYHSFKAHRVAWTLERGPIPDDKTLDHICRNPRCVNPSHLALVSNKENILRGISPTALNARRTHCTRGHQLVGGNIRPRTGKRAGRRECRACERIRKGRDPVGEQVTDGPRAGDLS